MSGRLLSVVVAAVLMALFPVTSPAYKIKGKIKEFKTPRPNLPGVVLTLYTVTSGVTGTIPVQTVGPTGSSGNYVLSDVAPGSYAVVPLKEGCEFLVPGLYPTAIPMPERYVVVTDRDVMNIDFDARPAKYSISGTVTDGSSGLAGVLISTSAGSTETRADGTYILPGLTVGTYVVTPTRVEYTFAPVNRSVTVTQNVTGVDFVGTVNRYSLGGRVTVGGVGLAGVLMT